MKQRKSGWLLALLLALALGAVPASAQTENQTLRLRLNRDFGYSNPLSNDIQGTFSYHLSGDENLVRVDFLLDGQVIGEDSTPPFRLVFRTGDFPLGSHTMQAIGYTGDGREVPSNIEVRNFVDPSAGLEAAGRFIVPLLALVALAVLIPVTIALLQGRGKPVPPGTPRKYGLQGGTICPRCGRPFSRHFWGLNLGLGKLDRCPHCGKWSVTRRLPLEQLRAAEQAELEGEASSMPAPTPEEQRRRLLDDSRFEDVDL